MQPVLQVGRSERANTSPDQHLISHDTHCALCVKKVLHLR